MLDALAYLVMMVGGVSVFVVGLLAITRLAGRRSSKGRRGTAMGGGFISVGGGGDGGGGCGGGDGGGGGC